MIFLTVGHSMPFDRMVQLVDEWAGATQRKDIFGQIGEGEYRPKNFSSAAYLGPAEYDRCLKDCDAVIAHAGTGTILQALYLGKPMLVLTRLSRLKEATTDHQVGTARYFAEQGQIMMAGTDAEFSLALNEFESFTPRTLASGTASPELMARIRRFLLE